MDMLKAELDRGQLMVMADASMIPRAKDQTSRRIAGANWGTQ